MAASRLSNGFLVDTHHTFALTRGIFSSLMFITQTFSYKNQEERFPESLLILQNAMNC